jgi:hypothetical protein
MSGGADRRRPFRLRCWRDMGSPPGLAVTHDTTLAAGAAFFAT